MWSKDDRMPKASFVMFLVPLSIGCVLGMLFVFALSRMQYDCPYRLSVRTLPFQGSKVGSIPTKGGLLKHVKSEK